MDIVRDPLWNNIRLDALALALLDTHVVQRLRYVRQLGHAFLVYPGATHARFEHALGAYHLAGLALRLLDERDQLRGLPADEGHIVRAAALLHDTGHYPFSHALEEIGAPHHEHVAKPLILDGPIAEVLRAHIGADAPERVFALITGTSTSPLQGLISGSLDLDKIEYLKRDAHMCGVPYGEIDVDRLLNSLVVVPSPTSGATTIGIHEKGLSALESLLFAKYQMYRNVYWHHAVRSATAMYKRLVADALAAGVLDAATVAHFTDEGLMHHLASLQLPPMAHAMLQGLRQRQLYKRALEYPAAELDEGIGEWIADSYPATRAVEDELAASSGLSAGALLLDYPAKTQMLGLDLPVVRRDGTVEQLTARGWRGAINLPRLSDELYRSARKLRVFTAGHMPLSHDVVMPRIVRGS
jgi:HD superfamily phosphohydrolase